jgi:hypothetical protein
MALRPVSELGLVDLTDLASPESAKPSRPAPRAKPPAKRPAQSTRPSQPAAKAATPTAPATRQRARMSVARASRIGVIAATWAAAGTGGMLLGRAAVRR